MHKKLIQLFTLLLLLLTQVHSVRAAAALPADVSIPFSENKTEWIDTVCQHATVGGCAYFRAHEAGPAWLALNALNASAVSIRFKEVIADFDSDLALMRLELTLHTASGHSETHEAYATISIQNGQARLDRIIVFDQTLIAPLE